MTARRRADTSGALQMEWAFQDPAAPQASRPLADPRHLQAARLALLVLSVLLNPLLASANAFVAPLSGGLVAAAQAGLVALAFLLIAMEQDGLRFNRWWGLTWAILAFGALLALVRDDFNPKFIADTLMIAAFVMIGAQLQVKSTLKVFLLLHAAIAVIGLWELQWPHAYVSLFEPEKYYINTRGYQEADFWTDTGLYASGVRPVGRFLLSWTNYHRGSSLFLEPVTLGNWTVLSTIVTLSFWRSWRPWERATLIAATVACLCVCDGRLAMFTSGALLVALPVLAFVPSRAAVLAPFLFWAGVLTLSHFGYLHETGDTVPGRLRFALDVMARMSWRDWLGFTPLNTGWFDAGYTYLIQSQSIVLALTLWGVLMLGEFGEGASARMYRFGTAIFLSVSLGVSYSTLSIKTAAWLWAFYGLLWAQSAAARDMRPQARPPEPMAQS